VDAGCLGDRWEGLVGGARIKRECVQ
jgi:hypothetical protein